MSKLRKFFDQLLEAVNANDEAAMEKLFDPSFVMYEDEGMPYGGTFHGFAGFRKVQQTVYSTWRDHVVENICFLEDADEEHMGLVMRLAGRPGKCDEWTEALVNEFWTVRGGKACEARVWYYDAERLAKLIA